MYYVSVIYNNKRIIPGPRISVERRFDRSPDGTIRYRGWNITITGIIFAWNGSPDATGTFWTGAGYPPNTALTTQEAGLGHLRNKIGALSKLFSIDGKWFEIIPGDGSPAIRFQPRWTGFQVPEGDWFDHVEFTATCETDAIFPFDENTIYNQSNMPPSESWSIERVDEIGRVYRLTHNASATGKKRFDSGGNLIAEGWQVAKDLVIGGATAGAAAINVLGLDTSKVSGSIVDTLGSFGAYNHVRNEQIDEAAGSYSITENWTLFNPADTPTGLTGGVAIEEYSVENRYSNDNGLNTVTVSGSITGLDVRDTDMNIVTTRWTNASLRASNLGFNWGLNLAQNETGLILNPAPITSIVSTNKINGVISYSITFDNRATLAVGNVLSTVISVDVRDASDVVAIIPVPFRTAGPIIQGMGTVTQKTIMVRAEIVQAVRFGSVVAPPFFNPLSVLPRYISGYTQIYQIEDNYNYVEQTGRYSRTTLFIFQ